MSELRDLLDEHAGPSPVNPARLAGVMTRVRRRRVRRAAVLSGTAGVAAVLLALPYILTPARNTEIATAPASPFPERYTADDGVEYSRLETARLAVPEDRKLSITVALSGRPLEVAVKCRETARDARVSLAVTLDRRPVPPGFPPCTTTEMLRWPLPDTRPGAATATITLTPQAHAMPNCTPGKGCKPSTAPPTPDPTAWDIAVYEWTPPAEPIIPGPPRAFPSTAGGWQLVRTDSGVYPRDKEVSFTSTGKGRFGFDKLCSGALSRQLRFRVFRNGRDTGSSGDCAVWEKGQTYPMAMSVERGPARITLKLESAVSPNNRFIRWSVGWFE
ncbi:hypothetical protein [Nonomuraea soli]|uniref:Uncharacterized protein n=1 Tax=Nonomuraea soli TaxID=1032476 RepID=A0A7W0HPM7_9ACTN|nr:hypothetical protein [Nonomuraea soli]MBA2891023.1 hypothetical protein [Nonomuraea soli]